MTVSQDTFLLSPQQLRVWRLGSRWGHRAFAARAVVTLDGLVEADLLQAALEELVARHEVLRTRFVTVDGEPGQRIDDEVAVELGRSQSSDQASDEPGGLFATLAPGDGATTATTTLVLDLPALAVDRPGIALLLAELAEIYRATELTGTPPEPDPDDDAPLQVVDVAEVLWEMLGEGAGPGGDGGGEAARARSFWETRSHAQPAGALRGQGPGAVDGAFEVAGTTAELDPDAAGRLTRLAALDAPRAGLEAVFAALWSRVLSDAGADGGDGGGDDTVRPVALGLLASGGGLAGVHRAPGPYTRVLPLSFGETGDGSIAAWIGAADRAVAEIRPWRELFVWERFAGDVPFARFQLEVAEVGDAAGPWPAGSVTFRPHRVSVHPDRFDLKLTVQPLASGRLALALDRDATRFDERLAERLVDRLLTLAEAVGRGTELPAPLVGEAERRHLLAVATGAPAPVLQDDTSLHGLFRRQAERTPDAIALEQGDERRTYRQLADAVDRRALGLVARGVGPEDRVALALPRSLAMVEWILAVLTAGGAYVPLDTDYPLERLEVMLADSGSRALVVADGAGEELAAGFAGDVVRPGDPDATSGSGGALPEPASGNRAAYVIYTSGSTGRPKGVVVTHRAIVNHMLWMFGVVPLGPGDAVLGKTPYAFDASLWETFLPLGTGARLVLAEPGAHRDPGALARAVADHRVTMLTLVPSQLGPMLDLGDLAGVRETLRYLYCGGEALSVDLARRAIDVLDVELANLYGPTEAAVDSTFHAVERERLAASGVVTIGRPIAGLRTHVLDPGLRLVPDGAPGELAVAGVGLARGYLGRPTLTAERFVPDPFAAAVGEPGGRLYRTGDLVRLAPGDDGEIDFLGRIDHQVKLRGVRIELGEVEAALLALPGVAQAAAEVRGDLLVAHVEGPESLEPGELTGLLARRLPAAMVPGAIMVSDALPRLPNGKVDRRALAEIDWARARSELAHLAADEAPRDPTEEIVAGVWADLLGLDRVGREEVFFEIGGQSILAMRVTARLASLFGVELGVADLFDQPTVAGLARRVRQTERAGLGSEVSPVEPLSPLSEAEVAAGVPLSFAQRRLWLVDRLQPGSVAYTIPSPVRFRGALRSDVLARALGEVVRRHAVLRSRFEGRDDGPVQRVEPVSAARLSRLPHLPHLPVIDLGALPAPAAEGEVRRLVTRDALRPFDLERQAPVRSALLRVAADDHVLLWTMHHLVSDAWSVGILVREVAALYGAFVAARPSPLPELPIQYADFAAWQHRHLSGEVLDRQLAVWRERLAGAPEVTPLPLDRPRRRGMSRRGDDVRLTLSSALVARLDAVGRQGGTTRFMTLLAVFGALLARYRGAEPGPADLVVGTPIAGRDRIEVEPLIGFFIQTLALRLTLDGDSTGRSLLGQVRRRVLEAFAHQNVPFERLVEELDLARVATHDPLVQVTFNLMEMGGGEPAELPGLTLEPLAADDGEMDFDLSVAAAPTADDGVHVTFSYRRALFDRSTVERLAGGFVRLAGALADAPDAPVGSWRLLGDGERTELLTDLSGAGRRAPDLDRDLVDLFLAQVAARPEAPAVDDGRQVLSYAELDRRSATLGRRLVARGARPGEPVALLLGRDAEQIVATLAVVRAGAFYVPLDPSHPPERLAEIVADTGARLVLFGDRHGDDSARAALEAALAARGATPELVDPACAEPSGDGVPLPANLAPELPAYAMYTSGSTGRPKGVWVPHRAVVRLVRGVSRYRFEAGDRMAQIGNVAFDAATWEIWMPLTAGGTLVTVEREVALDPAALAATLAARRIDALFLTTSLFNQVARRRPDAFAGLRTVIYGGEVADAPAVRKVLDTAPPERLVNVYGPTENTTYSTEFAAAGPEAVAADATAVSIGWPLVSTAVHLADGDGRLAPRGAVGEILLGGEGLALGYLGRPAETAERFVPDPWTAETGDQPGGRLYVTGDLARWADDGSLDFVGRIDHQVKIRGLRIEPGEVEAALATHPQVAQAAVVVAEAGPELRELVAYVALAPLPIAPIAPSPEPSPRPSPRDLAHYLATRMPSYMVPSVFVVLPELPLNPNGKIDRRALPPPGPDDRLGADDDTAPRTDTERRVAAIYEELLPGARVTAGSDFFDLGGHSLLATQVVSRLRQLFAVELPLAVLFDRPTVAGLAAAVEETRGDRDRDGDGDGDGDGGAAEAPMVAQDGPGPFPLSPAQGRLWFHHRLEPESGLYNMPTALRLEGRLDRLAMAAALDALVERHETLRTTYREGADGAEPVQVIAPAGSLGPPVVDLSALAPARREPAARRLVRTASTAPFDLVAGPVARALLLVLGEDDHALALTVHHIASDGWSQGVLVQELGALYGGYTAVAAGATDRTAELPTLDVRYADFAVWQRERLGRGGLERQVEHWRETLAGAGDLDLPLDRPRAPVRRLEGGLVSVSFSPETVAGIERWSRAAGVTPFILLSAAFAAVLGRLAGQEDLVIGSPVANRNRREIEPLVGFFVNTLPLRLDLSEAPTFAELVERTRAVALAAYDHQDVPFERLVEELDVRRDPSRTPLFQVSVLLNEAAAPLALPGLEVSGLATGAQEAKFDLGLVLQHGDGRLVGALDYAVALFDRTTIERWARGLERLLAAGLETPRLPVAALPFESPGARHQMLREWGRSLPVRERRLDRERTATLGTLFARQVAARPETALFEAADGTVTTYGGADLLARRIAAHLAAAGVGPWVPVVLAFDRGADQLVALLATLRAGGLYLPVDLAQPLTRLTAIVESGSAAGALGRPVVLYRRGDDPRADALVGALDGVDGAVGIDLGEIDGETGTAPELPWPDTDPGEPAYVMYTSGSTGLPKGVLVPHRGVVRVVTDTAGWSCRPGERIPYMANIAFDAATFEVWLTLAHGGTLVPVPREVMLDPTALTDFARDRRLAGMVLPAAVLGRIGAEVPDGLAGLRWASQGGEAADVEAVRRVLAAGAEGAGPDLLFNCYGPTETTVLAASERIEDVPAAAASVPIGRPAAATRLVVLGPDGRPVPLGSVGQLVIGGDGVSLGYLGWPARTAERFVPDPEGCRQGSPGARRYRTGDLVRHLADGRLDFVGRTDHQVKIRGLRIEPGEVEAVLAAQPGVEEAIVLVLGESQDRRHLAAFVASRSPLAPGELREAVAARLPRYMVPRSVTVLRSLPLNANDKVDLTVLAALEVSRGAADPSARPRTDTERLLVDCFRQVLELDEVGVHDDFFDIGGHSLLATQLVSRIRAATGRELPLAALFDRPTVAELAPLVESTEAGSGAGHGDGTPSRPTPRPAGMDEVVLSYSQERLFLLERFEPGNTAYSMPMAVAFNGRLERGVLARALSRVVERHEVLRTTFALAAQPDGPPRPVQRVHPADGWPVALPVVDVSLLTPERSAAERQRWVTADAERPFDLDAGPLYRFHLFVETPARTVFFMNLHHIVSDGWSFGLLIEEVTEFYGAVLAGRAPELSPLPVQYADYSLWQRRHLEGETRGRQLGYWRRQLEGAPATLDLPFDRPRRPVRTFAAGHASLLVPAPVAGALRRLAGARGATVFMVLLAAFEVVVARLSGETDVVVGTPVAGRSRDEVEPLLGMFLNTLVLRTDLSGDPTYLELVDRVRATALGAYDHQDVPFEMLLDELAVERDLSRSPLFQLFFNMVELPVGQRGALPGVELEAVSQPEIPAKFDLTLYAQQPTTDAGVEQPISLVASYDADLFDRQTIERLLAQMLRVMETMGARPEERIGTVSLALEADRAALPDPARPQDRTWRGPITDALARWAREEPERVAVEDPRVSWSYRQLAGRAHRLAHGLVAAGVGRGDRVAVWAHRSASLVEAVHGVLAAGGACVLLDPSYPAERAAEMVRRSGARALVALAAAGEPPSAVLAALEAQGGARLDLAPATAQTADATAAGTTTDDLDDPGAPRLVGGPLGPDDAAMVGFTSGSTGAPKGIVGRHGSLTHFLPWQAERFDLGASDRFAMLSSLAHDPLQRDLFTPVWLGATLVIPEAALLASGVRLSAWMAEARATVAHLTPAMGQILTQGSPEAEPVELTDVRALFLVGDALTRRDVARLAAATPAARVVNLYGSTETQRAVAFHPAAGPDLDAPEATGAIGRSGGQVLPLGRGMEDVQLLVLAPDGRRLAGVGEVGEIAVRSPHLALGYLGDPAATAARFVAHPLGGGSGSDGDGVGGGERVYLTGDLGRVLADGSVRFMGRSDHQVKIRGFRIELAEVESHLGEAPGVAEAAVIARSDGPLGARLAATVVPTGGAEPDATDLRRHLAARLPAYMVPATFVFLAELPLTANGKLDRRALARLDDRPAGGDGDGDHRAPSTETEKRLAALLADVLGLDTVGVDASFFELGGNSLLLVQLHGRLEAELGRKVPVVELFAHPTVRELAALVERSTAEDTARPDHREGQVRSGKDRLRRRRRRDDD